LASRREIASFALEKPVYWLAFSPDNQTLVWGSIGSYHVWRAPRGEPLASSGSVQSPVTVPPATSVWRVPDGDAPVPPQTLTEKSVCLTNLLRIHAAIMSYQKEHSQMPDSLGDLVPKYLPDTNSLLCPVHVATKTLPPSWLPIDDPKVTTSYSYEFSARTNQTSDPYGLAATGDTMKAWKNKQLARYGTVVPLVRCAEHGAVLNITYAGEIFEGAGQWERAVEVKWRAKDPAGAEQWCRKMEQEAKAEVLNELAWGWATSPDPAARDGRTAVRFAERAVKRTNRKDLNSLDTLSAAYAETGQFDKALTVELEAISLLSTEEAKQEFQSRLELYRQQRPYREEEF
jgi:tetratricopeptide (TPR) repeat protein